MLSFWKLFQMYWDLLVANSQCTSAGPLWCPFFCPSVLSGNTMLSFLLLSFIAFRVLYSKLIQYLVFSDVVLLYCLFLPFLLSKRLWKRQNFTQMGTMLLEALSDVLGLVSGKLSCFTAWQGLTILALFRYIPVLVSFWNIIIPVPVHSH